MYVFCLVINIHICLSQSSTLCSPSIKLPGWNAHNHCLGIMSNVFCPNVSRQSCWVAWLILAWYYAQSVSDFGCRRLNISFTLFLHGMSTSVQSIRWVAQLYICLDNYYYADYCLYLPIVLLMSLLPCDDFQANSLPGFDERYAQSEYSSLPELQFKIAWLNSNTNVATKVGYFAPIK